jgi:hypothetical protein
MKHLTGLAILLLMAFTTHAQIQVKVKAYLQGPYAGSGMMNARLYTLAGFPLNQPYNTAPWNYPGNESLLSVPDSVVDWVLVELRSAPDTIVDRKAGLLLRNGNIADPSDLGALTFAYSGSGSYYFAVHHRNHLAVMSAVKVAVPNPVRWDFSDTTGFPSYGGGSRAQVHLGSGVYGMIVGDVNRNNQLKYSGPGNDRSLRSFNRLDPAARRRP